METEAVASRKRKAETEPETGATSRKRKTEETTEAHECAICLEEKHETKAILQPCGHCFHWSCMSNWLLRANTCPLCRTLFTHVFPCKA